VKNGDVYVVDDALLNRPGPRIVEGLKEIERNI
jgi:ABC-type Fe3+-hydroxamate transport system substrate-binding protein